MAHKGKLYPRLYCRDLSMKPDGFTYLPQAWEWFGIQATGSASSFFVGKTFKVLFDSAINPYTGLVRWLIEQPASPFQNWFLDIRYQITQQANMATMKWVIGQGNVFSSESGPTNVTSSFPNNQLTGGIYNSQPSLLNVTSFGTVRAAGW